MTTDTNRTNQTAIEVDPDVPLVRITREFDAPAERVFRAHTDPELLKRWLGPRRHTMVVEEHDCRPGGSYRYRHESDGTSNTFHGCFHQVRANELIIQTFEYEGAPDTVTLERMELEDLPGGRCRLVATSLIDSFAARDAFVASGMDTGVVEGYERLDELLAAG